MRRLSALFIVVSLAAAAAACGGSGASAKPSLVIPSGLAGAVATASPTARSSATTSASARASTSAPVEASLSASPSATQSAQASLTGPTITVTAVDYQFTGMPVSVPVGTTLSLNNAGTEVHEMVVARKNQGVNKSWQELLQMPEEKASQYITILGGAIAAPGAAGDASLQLTEEGDYMMLCFVPQGTYTIPSAPPSQEPGASAGASPVASLGTSSGAPSQSPQVSPGIPHFMLGMQQEFKVTAANSTPGPIPSPMPSPSNHASEMPMSSGSPAASMGY